MRCKKCGNKLNPWNAFCPACGEAAPNAGTAAAPVPEGASPPARNLLQAPVAAKDFYGLAVLGFLGLAALVVLLVNGGFRAGNIAHLFTTACLPGIVAMAAAVSAQVKGPDLSVGALMGVASVIVGVIYAALGSALLGVMAAVAVCIAMGLFSGALCSLLKIPALLVTATAALAYRAFANVMIGAAGHVPIIQIRQSPRLFPIVFFILAVAVTVPVLLFLVKGGPSTFRTIMGFGAAALLAALAGSALTIQAGGAQPAVSGNSNYDLYVLIAFSAVLSSNRLLKSKLFAAGVGLFAALFVALASNAMAYLQMLFVQPAVFSVVAILLLAAASVAHGGLKGVLCGCEEGGRR